jgi:hypothetical protein
MSWNANLPVSRIIVHYGLCEEIVRIYEFCVSQEINKRFIYLFSEKHLVLCQVFKPNSSALQEDPK